jgi:hypothetical protein
MPLFESDGTRVLFVHIPKTGGTTIEKFLSAQATMTFYSRIQPTDVRVCPQHMVIRDLGILLGGDGWDRAFSIVRNPYDRIESEFCFRTDIGDRRYGQQIDFSTWLLRSLRKAEKKPSFWDNHFRPQTDFVDSGVTLFRYDNGLEAVIGEVSGWLKLNRLNSLENMNVSTRRSLTWSADALNFFNDFYSDDFKQLGYKKRRNKLKFFSVSRSR